MRPMASTRVASMQNTAAPDSASELIWVKCQSVASPSTAEYWHIGDTMMRLRRFRPRSLIGENNTLMGISGWEEKDGQPCLSGHPALLNPPVAQPSPTA